jgi:hypothetical protein
MSDEQEEKDLAASKHQEPISDQHHKLFRAALNPMSPVDHNKTLVLLYSFLSLTFILPLVGSPWIIAMSVRNSEQLPIAIMVGVALLLVALLFLTTALALYRRKPYARTLALVSAVLVLPICWRMGVYTWRFMHTVGGKKLYKTTAR